MVAIDDQDTHPIDTSHWGDLAEAVLRSEGLVGTCELNLTFVDVGEMTELNVAHMDGSGPTDVLSFPLDDDEGEVFDGQPRLLGDVVICPEVVQKQAPDDTDAEMALMVVHGVLHILGMDHQDVDEALEMKAAEQRHLNRWRGLTHEGVS